MVISKSKIIRLIEYIIGFLFIVDCRSLYGVAFTWGKHTNDFVAIAMIIYIILTLNTFQQNKFIETIEISLIVGIYLLIYGILAHQTHVYFRLMLIVILTIWIIKLGPQKNGMPRILIAYGRLLSIIALISLFFWFFGSFLKIIRPTGMIYSSWGAADGKYNLVPTYHNLYFESQINDLDFSLFQGVPKNSAIFTEAPMAALNFSIGLLIQLFDKNNKFYRFRVSVLTLGILSTFSITGYIFLLLFLLLNQSKINHSENIKYLNMFICFIAIMLIILYLYTMKTEANMASVSVRRDDYNVGFRAWLSHPILGIGIQNYDVLKNFMESWRYFNTGFSNSIMDILSGGGLYLTTGYLFCFAKGTKDSYKTNKNKLIFVILMFYFFVTTFFTYTDILLFCLVWFACKTKNEGEA